MSASPCSRPFGGLRNKSARSIVAPSIDGSDLPSKGTGIIHLSSRSDNTKDGVRVSRPAAGPVRRLAGENRTLGARRYCDGREERRYNRERNDQLLFPVSERVLRFSGPGAGSAARAAPPSFACVRPLPAGGQLPGSRQPSQRFIYTPLCRTVAHVFVNRRPWRTHSEPTPTRDSHHVGRRPVSRPRLTLRDSLE